MRAILDMLLRDLRARVRDRSAIVIALVAPLALMMIFSALLSGTEESSWPIGYLPSATATSVDKVLTGAVFPAVTREGVATITTFATEQELRKALDDDTVGAALVSAAANATAPLGAITVDHRSDSPISTAIATSLANAAATQIGAAAKLAAAERTVQPSPAGDPQTQGAQAAAQLAAQPVPLVVSDAQEAGGLSAKTQIAAGMATFFLFFTVQFGLLGLLQERREGTLARLLAAVSPRQVLIAKLLVSFVLGAISMIVLLLVARVLLGADLGSFVGVLILILCGVGAATATVALVVGLARTPEQAGLAQSMVALVLGILGGSFFSTARSGTAGQIATRLTPHHWFLEGLTRMSQGSGWTAVLGPAGALLAFTVVIGVPGVVLSRRSVRP